MEKLNKKAKVGYLRFERVGANYRDIQLRP